VKIVDERQNLLEYLMSMNLVPGTNIEVIEKAPFNGPITIKIDGKKVSISRKIASIVRVRGRD
jgi:DtxR family Mn-dependent transcriptional regulator